MRSYEHRRTGDPLDRLTTEERHKAFQMHLATEVGTACSVWLRARGIPSPGFNRDRPDKARQHGKDGRFDGTGGADTPGGGGMQSPDP